MIRQGDIVTVRTYISKRRTKAKVLFVNYLNGWYTAEVITPHGYTYPESFWLRDADEQAEKEGRSKPKGKRWWEEEDNSAYWLDEWSEGRYGK